MFTYHYTKIKNNSILVKYKNNYKTINVKDFLLLLLTDVDFINCVNQSIINCPFDAIYYESMPIGKNNLNKDYFCIFVFTHFPKIKADYRSFKEKINIKIEISTFKSLSGITTLIVPNYYNRNYEKFLHLKMFIKFASAEQTIYFWKEIGKEATKQLKKNKIIWLKTHGKAVYYLHFRIQNSTNLYVTKGLDSIEQANIFFKNINNK